MDNSEQLRLLSIFHYVLGGLEILFGLFGIMYLGMGLSLALSPLPDDATVSFRFTDIHSAKFALPLVKSTFR